MTLLSSRNSGIGNVSLEAEFPFKCVFICHSNRHELPPNLYDSVYTVSFSENFWLWGIELRTESHPGG